MQVNLPYQVRAAIYIAMLLGSAVLVPLHVAHIVSDLVFNVWTSLCGAGGLLAAINVTPESQ